MWNVYGTLLAIPLGELAFEHPTPFVMSNALDKTIGEFKMWASMSRKPGQPADDLLRQYKQILSEQLSKLACRAAFANGAVAMGVAKRAMRPTFKGDLSAIYQRLRGGDCPASRAIPAKFLADGKF